MSKKRKTPKPPPPPRQIMCENIFCTELLGVYENERREGFHYWCKKHAPSMQGLWIEEKLDDS